MRERVRYATMYNVQFIFTIIHCLSLFMLLRYGLLFAVQHERGFCWYSQTGSHFAHFGEIEPIPPTTTTKKGGYFIQCLLTKVIVLDAF